MSSTYCNSRATLLLVAALLTIAAQGAASFQCRASYDLSAPGRPLLLGGIGDQGRCKSGCQQRDREWSERCGWVESSSWGTCTKQQTQTVLETAKTLGGGALLRFSPCDMMQYLQGRTLWLIGDSHSKSMYQALQCFLFDFHNGKQCEASADSSAVQQLNKLPVAPGESKCFMLFGGGRVCMVHVVLGTSLVQNNQIAAGGVLPLLRQKFAKPEDILYVSVGSWHARSTEAWKTLRPSLTAFGQDYQANRGSFPHVLFREQPAYHQAVAGSQVCSVARGLDYQPSTGDLLPSPAAKPDPTKLWQLGVTTNKVAREVLSTYSMPVVPGFNMTVPLHAAHVGKYGGAPIDCIHYCHPGVPETWIWYLYDAMRSGKAGISPLSPGAAPFQTEGSHKCVPSHP